MRVIIQDKNSHLKFHSISLAFLVKKKGQKQISLEITRQRNKHSMTRKFVHMKSYFKIPGGLKGRRFFYLLTNAIGKVA